jgi:hypothetical protein
MLNGRKGLAILPIMHHFARQMRVIRTIVCWSVLIAVASLDGQVKPKSSEQPLKASGDTWVLREDGIGPVNVGMTVAQLNAILGANFSMPKGKEDQSCFYLEPKAHPQVAFMMIDGRLARIDVNRAGVPTESGIQVGETEAKTLKVYGPGLKVDPHAYTAPDGHYLTIRSKEGQLGLRFETYKGRIEMFYAGQADAIQYIEGCE